MGWGWGRREQVCNEPSYLEDLTGLTEMHKGAALAVAEWDEDGGDNSGEDDF